MLYGSARGSLYRKLSEAWKSLLQQKVHCCFTWIKNGSGTRKQHPQFIATMVTIRANVIWQKATSGSAHYVVCKRNLVDIFCHIRQVAARIAKLVLCCTFGTPILGKGGQRCDGFL